MERESQSAPARLMAALGDRLPYINFYRFCQLLEHSQLDKPVIGSDWRLREEPVRFRPHPGMGFPAGELKAIEPAEHPNQPSVVRVTFMGLYGVESPLPSSYVNDITQQREGYEATADFLDIFNHRLIAQYYRIWRKYSYPATFRDGGQDDISQYLLGLAGLGIDGCAKNIATPVSRFLALLPMMVQPGCTAQGLSSLIRLLAPHTRATLWHHDKQRIPLETPLTMRVSQPVSLKSRPIMGTYATDVNGQVLMHLTTTDREEAQGWLPGGSLHNDLMALLHVYPGSRFDVRLRLSVPRSLLPDATMRCHPGSEVAQLGRTAVMRPQAATTPPSSAMITISLGRFQRLQQNIHRRETDENGDYHW